MDFSVRGQCNLQSEFQDIRGYTEKPCLGEKKKEWLYVNIAVVARKGHKLWEDVCNDNGSVLDVSSIETTSAGLETQTQERAEKAGFLW